MIFENFIKIHNIDKSSNPANFEIIKEAENLLGVKFGKELIEYVTKYGYLGFKFIELYGINLKQGLNSDMIKQTQYLHKYFPITQNFIAIENQGEGDYFIIDTNDKVYEYDTNIGQLREINLTLFKYILKRFEEI